MYWGKNLKDQRSNRAATSDFLSLLFLHPLSAPPCHFLSPISPLSSKPLWLMALVNLWLTPPPDSREALLSKYDQNTTQHFPLFV